MNEQARYDKMCRRFCDLISNLSKTFEIASAMREDVTQELVDALSKSVDESRVKHETFDNSILLYIKAMSGESVDEVEGVQTEQGFEIGG